MVRVAAGGFIGQLSNAHDISQRTVLGQAEKRIKAQHIVCIHAASGAEGILKPEGKASNRLIRYKNPLEIHVSNGFGTKDMKKTKLFPNNNFIYDFCICNYFYCISAWTRIDIHFYNCSIDFACGVFYLPQHIEYHICLTFSLLRFI